MSVRNNITIFTLVSEWLDIDVKFLQETLDKNGVSRDRMILFNSFVTEVVGRDDDVQLARLKYAFYLRYIDMGVGRGVPVGSRASKVDFFKKRNRSGQLHRYLRKKRPVYNSPMTYQVKRLGELMEEIFGIKTVQAIDDVLQKGSTDIEIKL